MKKRLYQRRRDLWKRPKKTRVTGGLQKYFDQASPEYVVLHAWERARRGKSPSAGYAGVRNPRKAIELARAAITQTGFWMASVSPSRRPMSETDIELVTKLLGVLPPSLDQLYHFLGESVPAKLNNRIAFHEWYHDAKKLELGSAWGIGFDFRMLSQRTTMAFLVCASKRDFLAHLLST